EEEQVAFAGGNHSERATIGRDREIPESQAVQDGLRVRLTYGSLVRAFAGGGEQRQRDPYQVARPVFGRALDEQVLLIGRPFDGAEADTHARQAVGILQVADFQYFFVDEVGGVFSGRRDGESSLIAVERGQFLVVLCQKLQALQARRA